MCLSCVPSLHLVLSAERRWLYTFCHVFSLQKCVAFVVSVLMGFECVHHYICLYVSRVRARDPCLLIGGGCFAYRLTATRRSKFVDADAMLSETMGEDFLYRIG